MSSSLRGARTEPLHGVLELTGEVHIAEGTVAWPGGVDIAPDTLYERVRSGAWLADVVAADAGSSAIHASAAFSGGMLSIYVSARGWK